MAKKQAPSPVSIEITKENLRGSGTSKDPTALPTDLNLRFSEYHYRWARKDKVDFHRVLGYRPVNYDDNFLNTGSFEKDERGYVRLGDCILMAIPMRGYKAHQATIRERLDRWERAEKDSFHNAGAALGVETIEDDSPEEE